MYSKNLAVYPALFEYAQDGITVTFPDLPGCITCAQSEDEAHAMARDALGVFITACEALGKDIPAPSSMRNITPEENQVPFMVDAWLPLFRERRDSGSVKKNVTVPVWLNTLAEQAHLNFSQILQAGIKSSLGITR